MNERSPTDEHARAGRPEQVLFDQERSMRLPPDPEAIAVARRFVSSTVREWGFEPTADTALLTSETVTNATQHAATDVIVLSVGRVGGTVHVGVWDADPTPPEFTPVDPRQVRGMGMQLLRALSSDWGVTEIRDDGKRIWFELELGHR